MNSSFCVLGAAAVALVSSIHSASASWTYTETNGTEAVVVDTSKAGKGSLTDGVWTFYTTRAKGTKNLTVDASKGGVAIATESPASIDFTDIEGGYKLVSFTGWRNNASPLVKYATEFIAPDCTTLSGEDTFNNNLNLTNVKLCTEGAVSLKSNRTFQNCRNLASFAPRKISSNPGSQLFMNCVSLDGSFEFPDATEMPGTFTGCTMLGGIKAEKVTSIGQSTFASCVNLSNIVLSSSVEYISNYAFDGCKKISTEFVQGLLNKGLKRLGNNATTADRIGCFKDCTGLTGTLVWDLPDLLTNAVPASCFQGCSSLERVEIKTAGSIVDIGNDAFAGLKPGAEIVLPAEPAKGFYGRCAVSGANVPYPKVYLNGAVDEWLEKMRANNFVITRADFENTEWSQYQEGWKWTVKWDEMRDRMVKDESMCVKGDDGVPVVLDKLVVAFVYYRSSSVPGRGCWVLKVPESRKGLSIVVR